jgi:PAS domain S-box-containing protein
VIKPTITNRKQGKNGARGLSRISASTVTHKSPSNKPRASKPREMASEVVRLQLEAAALRTHLERVEARMSTLAAERDYYANVYDFAPVGDVLLDVHGNILHANRQAKLVLGLRPTDPLDVPFNTFVANEDLQVWLAHLRQAFNAHGPTSTELKVTLPRSRMRPVELLSTPLVSRSEPPRLRTLLIDITQREAAQTALQASQHNYRALINAIEGIVWEADPKTMNVAFVSQSAERILGYSTDYWYQPGFWSRHIHVADRERVLDVLTKALARGTGYYTIDYRMLDAQRNTLWMRDTISIFTHNGRTRLLGVAVNITDRKELEERLGQIQSELETRVRERTAELTSTISDLEAFSYSVSHDLRAPLRAMEGYAQLLQQKLRGKLDPLTQDFLNRISNSAQRLDALIQDVLKYSRVARAPVELQPVNLDKLVDGIIKDYPNLQPPKADIEVRKPLLPVTGNEAFLTQCISNLLSNGVKFVKPGDRPRVRVWTQASQDSVKVCFEDNGIGVAPENQHRIFGIFQRMHSHKEYEGTGIGLAIVKKAAERMNGHVGVDSKVGKGSRFWLELPRA